jgi:hypothetical protein
VVAECHRLGALHVRVAGHQRLGLGVGEVEQHGGESPDPLTRLLARVLHVEPHRRDDLIVARTAGVDLAPQLAEQPLDRGMDILVGVGHAAFAGDSLECLRYLHQLVIAQQPGTVQAHSVLLRGRAVVGKELAIGCAQKLRHLGRKSLFDPVRPERHDSPKRSF